MIVTAMTLLVGLLGADDCRRCELRDGEPVICRDHAEEDGRVIERARRTLADHTSPLDERRHVVQSLGRAAQAHAQTPSRELTDALREAALDAHPTICVAALESLLALPIHWYFDGDTFEQSAFHFTALHAQQGESGTGPFDAVRETWSKALVAGLGIVQPTDETFEAWEALLPLVNPKRVDRILRVAATQADPRSAQLMSAALEEHAVQHEAIAERIHDQRREKPGKRPRDVSRKEWERREEQRLAAALAPLEEELAVLERQGRDLRDQVAEFAAAHELADVPADPTDERAWKRWARDAATALSRRDDPR